MSEVAPFISFPERYLGSRSIKFPLLVNHPGFFAISKPAGMACFRHDWTEGKPDISMALRRELLNEKPQLKALGVEGLFRIYPLDAELSGVLLYAKNEEWELLLRNAFGSRQIRFRFHLLATSEQEEREFNCALPVARHTAQSHMLVSHKTGKKSETRFRYLRSYGKYQLWEAETTDLRMHQIRLHAAESGLKIVGEELYSSGERIYLSMIKRDYRGGGRSERPIYESLCVHLLSLEFEIPGQALPEVNAPLPKGFRTLLKRLENHKGR